MKTQQSNLTTMRQKEFGSSQGQLNSIEVVKTSTPPVFKGFEVCKNDSDGFFIKNTADGSIFKWIDITKLKCNGKFDGQNCFSQAGRRNFQGHIWNCFNTNDHSRGYVETDDKNFRKSTEQFGGFYLAAYRATHVSYSDIFAFVSQGRKVDMITFNTAKRNAAIYARKFAKQKEFISALPCGAAIDCFAEDVYERLEKEVLEVKEPKEKMYHAWNRYSKEILPRLKENGIYGVHDFISSGAEITSEAYDDIRYQCVIRGGARGVFLISYYESEINNMECYFEVGERNFISSNIQFIDHGYRIVLLPQKV